MVTESNARQAGDGHAPALLGQRDWNDEWMRLQDLRRKMDSRDYWDKRSAGFDKPGGASAYVSDFLALANLEGGASVLDMGCGTGSIAIPLAKRGHPVIAADFSEGMLDELRKRAGASRVTGLRTLAMAWEDDWGSRGVAPGSVDVVIASRSLAVRDLGAALGKMSATARKRCVATLSCGCSPRMDARILKACGLGDFHGSDFQYAFNILVNWGCLPECSYIYSVRKDTFGSAEDAREAFGRMIDDVAHLHDERQVADARAKLAAWLEGELVENEEAGLPDEKGQPQGPLRLREPRVIPWAFLSWNV